jgi:ion channel
MSTVLALGSVLLIVSVLLDGFEAMLLPRRVTRALRFWRLFYRFTWMPWAAIGRRMPAGRRRESWLSLYGPMSILALFVAWAIGLIVGFAALHQALDTPLNTPGGLHDPLDYLYMSGTTFFTLGFGDVTPAGPLGRALAVIEAGIGFGFLAAMIGYLPVLYAAFSRREIAISLLDARAGSPPTAAEGLTRVAATGRLDGVARLLEEWERWAAEVLESHLSFPVLPYYRSQHDNQSWLAALTAMLDSCALLMTRIEYADAYQAGLTFAMARHAAVDLSQIFRAAPREPAAPRSSDDGFRHFLDALRGSGIAVRDDAAAVAKFAELRAVYEPFVAALAYHFVLTLPPIVPGGPVVDNWQTSAWMRRTVGLNRLAFDPVFDGQAE